MKNNDAACLVCQAPIDAVARGALLLADAVVQRAEVGEGTADLFSDFDGTGEGISSRSLPVTRAGKSLRRPGKSIVVLGGAQLSVW